MSSQIPNFAYAMSSSVTANGAVSLSTPDPSGHNSGRMALFFKSVRGLNAPQQYQYMINSLNESEIDTFLLAFHIRDCRGGKGEREIGRRCLIWLFINKPLLFKKVLKLLPEYGRWDDLLQLFPGVLKLSDINYVRNNYVSNIPDSNHLETLQHIQKQIVQLFGSKIKEDYTRMVNGETCSLAAKWAPTEGGSLDSKTGVFKTLANEMKISPRDLRKKYITPLREYLRVVERFMCERRWDEIDYNTVPSCAMKRLKKSFEKNDEERFQEWRDALKNEDPNVAKVNAKQLLPYELVREMRIQKSADDVCKAQWKILEDECAKNGCFNSDVAVVDTSASMHSSDYLPFDVATSLGLLISKCSDKFKNMVLTFNTVPEFVMINDGSIYERWRQVTGINWGGSTNIQATFELILQKGRQFDLKQEDMPKRLWIISDMQFNQVNGYGSITNFEAIEKMYSESGYTRPQIVFWNVNGNSTDFPVTSGENGTALISGFSPSVMKAILSGKDFSPYSVMRDTLDSDRLLPVRKALEDMSDSNESDSKKESVDEKFYGFYSYAQEKTSGKVLVYLRIKDGHRVNVTEVSNNPNFKSLWLDSVSVGEIREFPTVLK